MRDRPARRAEGRLLVLAVFFFCAFGDRRAHGGAGQSEPGEPRTSAGGQPSILAQRADIVDREGRILATNFDTHSLYAQPPQMIEPEHGRQSWWKSFPISTARA